MSNLTINLNDINYLCLPWTFNCPSHCIAIFMFVTKFSYFERAAYHDILIGMSFLENIFCTRNENDLIKEKTKFSKRKTINCLDCYVFVYTIYIWTKRCFIVFLLMKFKKQNSQSHCCNLKLAIAAKFDENWNSVATKIKLSFWAFNNIIGSLYNSKNLLSFLYRYAFIERWTYFTFKIPLCQHCI